MTITKKPAHPKTSVAPPDAIASAYIEATEKRAKGERALATEPATKAAAKTKTKAKPATAPRKVAEDATLTPVKEKKEKEKNKDKDKSKKKKNKKKEAVIIRFEDAQLAGIDASADALGLSRAAWVRMVVARALIKS